MRKPDDCNLDPYDLKTVEARAGKLLDRADAWNRFPTPIEDILAAAQLTVAPTSVFDPKNMLAYLREKGVSAGLKLKKAISKILGLYDADTRIIHIDDSVVEVKQKFLTLHETGHHELPTHRKVFTWFQDCEKTLDPDVADHFEREANNFARFALFQGDAYGIRAADYHLAIKTPMALAKQFGSSVYASVREFVRTNHRPCVAFVMEPVEYVRGDGASSVVRRIVASPSFEQQFGMPSDTIITPDHALGALLPVGQRKMIAPTEVVFADRNGDRHECLAESFKTKWNVFILVYPVKALTGTTIVLPTGT